MESILLALVVWGAAIGVGLCVVDWLDNERRFGAAERIPIAATIGLWLMYHVIWAIGAVRLDRTSMLALLSAGGVVATMRLWKARSALRAISFDLDPKIAAMVGGVAVLVLGMIVGALAPAADADALRYHLLLPKRDVELGRIGLDPFWSIFDAFPAAMEMLYRMALAIGNEKAAQQMHVCAALLAATATYGFGRRCGLSLRASMLAALFFLGIRVVMYQSSTADVDLGVVLTYISFVSALIVWRETPNLRLTVLSGLLGASVIGVKYTGIPLLVGAGLAILAITPRWRILMVGTAMAFVAAAGMAPLFLHNFITIGNPIFPILHNVFGSEFVSPLQGAGLGYTGTGGMVGFFLTPIDMFLSLRYDGPQFGAPYLLIFAPFAIAARKRLRHASILLAVLIGAYIAWFMFIPRQARMLMPVAPVMAVFAAVGAALIWDWVKPFPTTRRIFIGLCGLIVLFQSAFYVGTAVRRFPAAFGLISTEAYLNSSPFRDTAHYTACRFLERSLRPGEKYISLTANPSFYCPQAALQIQLLPEDRGIYFTAYPRRIVGAEELASFLETNRVRLIFDDDIPGGQMRTNIPAFLKKGSPFDRFDDTLRPALDRMRPLMRTGVSRIYDAGDVIMVLRAAGS
jgi:hypothetical protein